jgi:hypothetical protein
MSFPEKSRQWWLRVWGNGDASKAGCQKTFYSEDKGFHRHCDRDNLYVMVIEIEGRGSVGVPICRHHFMELTGTNIYGRQSSLYPELAWARRDYKDNKNSFDEVEHSSDTHRSRAGDWSTDEYLFDLAKAREHTFMMEHPEEKKPQTKARHFRTWVDIVYDGFYGENQEKS